MVGSLEMHGSRNYSSDKQRGLCVAHDTQIRDARTSRFRARRTLLPKTIFYIYIRKSKHNLGLECCLPYLLTYVLYAFHARRRVISLDFAPSLRHVVKSPFVRWSLNRLRTVLFSCFTDQMNELLEFIIHSLAFERRDPRTVT